MALKIVQLKTPLGLQDYLWLNGALVSLQELLELLNAQQKKLESSSADTSLVTVQFVE